MLRRVMLVLLVVCALAGEVHPAAAPLAGKELDVLWVELASTDVPRAFQVVLSLARAGDTAVRLLDKHVTPVTPPEQKRVARLIKDLENDRYPVRARAALELARLGELVEANLRKRLVANPPLEVQRRIEQLLKSLQGAPDVPTTIQAMRALEVLETIGTPEARRILDKIGRGFPGARLTQEARDALERLAKREGSASRAVSASAKPLDSPGDPVPAGAVLRLGSARFRHPRFYGKVIFSPDGRSLAIPGENEVRLMDVKTGKTQRRLRTNGSPQLLAFTAAGKLVTVSSVHTPQGLPVHMAQTWDLSGTGLPQMVSWQEQGYLYSQAISGDGKTLAAFSGDSTLRAWDLASGKEISRQQVAGRHLYLLALTKDGLMMAATGDQNGVLLWNRKTSTVRNVRNGPQQSSGLAFSPDGKILVAAGAHNDAVGFWNTSTCQLIRSLPTDGGALAGAVFSLDGKALATLHHKPGIWLWDPAAGTVKRKLDTDGLHPQCLAFSPDSRFLAADFGAAVRIWDLQTGKAVAGWQEGHVLPVTALAFSTQGVLATVGEDNAVRLWDLPAGRERRVFPHSNWVRAVAFSPNGKLLATSCFDDSVHVFEPGSGREIYKLAGHSRIGGRRALRFAPDSRTLLSWGDDFYLRAWNMANGKALREFRVGPPGLKLPDDDDDDDKQPGKAAAQALMAALRRREIALMGQGGAGFSPSGREFIITGANALDFVNTATGKYSTEKMSGNSHGGTLTFAPDGKWALVGHGQRFDILHLPSRAWGYSLPRDQKWGNAPAISADGRTIAIAAGEHGERIELWEKLTGKKRLTLRGFDGSVRCLACSDDGRYLVAGLDDATALVWDLVDLPREQEQRTAGK